MENREHIMKPSEDQHSVSESGVAGGFCPHSQEYREPPQVCFEQKNAGDLPKSTETWSDDHLPIDIILLTVESCDFLSCFSLLDKPFKSYKKEIGYVYFGVIGDTSDQEKLKIALVKCCKGAATPGGSLTAVLNAVRVLRPKAAFSVGTCISLSLENVKMGDVVISSKLTAEGFRTPVSPLLSRMIQDAPYGWVAPLQNPDEMEVKVHCDGDILSQSQGEKCRCDDVFERYPGAVAIDTGGEGLYAAAYDANIEWLIVKGVASYFHQSQSVTSEWMSFASTMAASMVAKMLKDPTVFREWPHYKQVCNKAVVGMPEGQPSLRQYGDKIIKLLIQAAKLRNEQQEKAEKMLTQLAQSYEECHDVSTDNGVEALEAFTEYLISAYGVVLIAVGRGSVIIILECIALESLERVWNDYVSGRLDEVAQEYLVSKKMKKELKLETNCLKTTIHMENYLNCKKALMELPSTYSERSSMPRTKRTPDNGQPTDDQSSTQPSHLSFPSGQVVTEMANHPYNTEVEKLSWYHYSINRHAAEGLLMANGKDGSYLLRASTSNPGEYSLSLKCSNSVKHFQIGWDGSQYRFGMGTFSCLNEFVEHFENKPLIGGDSGVLTLLKYPYPRDIAEPATYEKVRVHAEWGKNRKSSVANSTEDSVQSVR